MIKFAYVSFIDDKVKKIVKIDDIKHGAKIASEGKADVCKLYKVLFDDGEYYKANIICLGETYEAVEKIISIKRPRLPLNRLINEYANTSSADSEPDVASGQKSSERKKKGLTSPQKENLGHIMSEILNNKKIIKKGNIEKDDIKNLTIENNTLREELQCLRNRLEEKQKKIDILESLNYKLQEEILAKWKDVTQSFNSNSVNRPDERAVIKEVVATETRRDGKIHLGRDVWLSEHLYDKVDLRGKNPTKFVKELALNLFGIKVLKNSSVTGRVSNRTKADAKTPLDPQKIMAIKDVVAWRLRKDNEDEGKIRKICHAIPSIISQKIIDLNRPSRPSSMKGSKRKTQDVENEEEQEEQEENREDTDVIEDQKEEIFIDETEFLKSQIKQAEIVLMKTE